MVVQFQILYIILKNIKKKKIFVICPVVLNYVQHIFQGEAKIFAGGEATLVTGPLPQDVCL